MSSSELRVARGHKLGSLTRIIHRAEITIASRGSRTALIGLLKDLDLGLEAVLEVNASLVSTLNSDEEIEKAAEYASEAERRHEKIYAQIKAYLEDRANEPPSQASSVISSVSLLNNPEIDAQVKELEALQLKERVKQERQSYELDLQRRVQVAEDAVQVARLKTKLVASVASGLELDRQNDFVGEPAIRQSDNSIDRQAVQSLPYHPSMPREPLQPSPFDLTERPSRFTKLENPPVTHQPFVNPLTPHIPQPTFIHSLPKLTLPKFSGSPAEWPKWSALFRSMVDSNPYLSDTEKMAHLQSAVSGAAQRTIEGMTFDGSLYAEALHVLHERFGGEEDIVSAHLKNMFRCAPPVHLNPSSMENFYGTIHTAVTVLRKFEYEADLNSSENLRRVAEKLPTQLKLEWSTHRVSLMSGRPSLVDFDIWLGQQVKISHQFESIYASRDRVVQRIPRPVTEGTVQRTMLLTETSAAGSGALCICCGQAHHATSCAVFKQRSPDDRAIAAAQARSCFSCLRTGHFMRSCRVAKPCGVNGCRKMHHYMLHESNKLSPEQLQPLTPPETESRVVAASMSSPPATAQTLLQVVPVVLTGSNGQKLITCALLDPGAQTSLCTESLLEDLGIRGEPSQLTLHNVEGRGLTRKVKRVQLTLSPLKDQEVSVEVPEAFSIEKLNVSIPSTPTQMDKWEHLKGLEIPDLSGHKIDLLLGANVVEAVIQLEAKIGRPGQPVAVKTVFGWALTGSMSTLVPEHIKSGMHIGHATRTEDDLEVDLRHWWSTESFGTAHKCCQLSSPEDNRALQILKETVKFRDGHYEAGLLWRKEEVSMPDNFSMASARLKSLERSLSRRTDRAEAYKREMSKYIDQGHAHLIHPDELQAACRKRWYLPHHAVFHPLKCKLRVVFDAASELDGISLNNELLTGPDLLQNLVGVLTRFREERVALVADVEQMFHQVRIIDKDQPALSFLWRNCISDTNPSTYQMSVAVFGAKCSPTIANYVLRKISEDLVEDSTESRAAAAAVKRHFYMDDFLKSEKSATAARIMRKEMTQLLGRGGFNLTKWRCSHSDVLSSEEQTDVLLEIGLSILGQGADGTLGYRWNSSKDILQVNCPKVLDASCTKRGVLSVLSRVFDPLGLVSPFVLRGKILVQQLWTNRIGWDQEIEGECFKEWMNWISQLPELEKIEVPRCLQANVNMVARAKQLHIFCDASQNSFGAVAYVRMSYGSGDFHSRLIISKTRLAPLKQLTIVRLELQAAVLAVRLAETIRVEMDFEFDAVHFWSDSKVVLQFICHESRRFHTFVANRVSEIQAFSDRKQWHHVPGKLNPADACTRGLSVTQLKDHIEWWQGPVFLSREESEWPSHKHTPATALLDHVEVKGERAATVCSVAISCEVLDSARFSSWIRYIRTYTWILRFVDNLKAAVNKLPKVDGPLTSSELRIAEQHVFRAHQSVEFSVELEQLTSKGTVAQNSLLNSLSPVLGEHGLIRVGGRLAEAPIDYHHRHPIILASKGHLTRLIIQDIHVRTLHSGLEHTLNEVRTRYWFRTARSVVKGIIRHCLFCKRRRTSPSLPRMADLPTVRFDSTRAFNNVGIDYLGPFQVKKFRKIEKRYVLLITCLSTRAIHLEVACSLDLDSFIMALRRFCSRRGSPTKIFSDNGSSFVAGDKELREAVEGWNRERLFDEVSHRGIEWVFNPPGAPHMGGVWERLVKSVKRALKVILGKQCVCDEVFQTVIVEAEYMVNSRPLTYVSSDARDLAPLTPNHFVLGHSHVYVPCGTFPETELSSRRRWKHTQVIAEHLWKRWKREYIPTLMARQKWLAETRSLKVDDVVLMLEENTPRGYWPLARVVEVFPGRDGRVRSVKVQTASQKNYHRPASKICLLEEVE